MHRIKLLIISLLFMVIGLGQERLNLTTNLYIFSISQNKTLCTANKVNNNGTIELQMRCYDTTTSVPSYRLLLNTSIFDTVVTKAGEISCAFQFSPDRTQTHVSCGAGTSILLDTIYSVP